MSGAGQIEDLESAIVARARKLAEEYITEGQRAREHILEETQQRLRAQEEREVLAAEAAGERAYQQQVQAAELAQRAELDRLRWTLIGAVLDNLPAHLAALCADETRYLPLLLAYLRDAAQAIERDSLVVQVNAHDLQRLQPNWDAHTHQIVAAGKHLTLSPTAIDTLGGVLVTSAEGDIRVDHSFEARMERMHIALHGAVAAQLFPATLSPAGAAAHG